MSELTLTLHISTSLLASPPPCLCRFSGVHCMNAGLWGRRANITISHNACLGCEYGMVCACAVLLGLRGLREIYMLASLPGLLERKTKAFWPWLFNCCVLAATGPFTALLRHVCNCMPGCKLFIRRHFEMLRPAPLPHAGVPGKQARGKGCTRLLRQCKSLTCCCMPCPARLSM